MNDIFISLIIMFVVHPICIQDSISKMSSESPDWTLSYSGLIYQPDWSIGHVNQPAIAGLILDLRPANERRRYFVTTSLIDWAPT